MAFYVIHIMQLEGERAERDTQRAPRGTGGEEDGRERGERGIEGERREETERAKVWKGEGR